VYEQANARIRRVGQQHKQQYFHMQSTSVERKIYAGLRQKQRLQDEFLDMIRTATEDL
jgi:SNF2 family DNA or RNA helicase